MNEAAVDVLVPAAVAPAPSTRPHWLRRLIGNHSVVAGALILLVFVSYVRTSDQISRALETEPVEVGGVSR